VVLSFGTLGEVGIGASLAVACHALTGVTMEDATLTVLYRPDVQFSNCKVLKSIDFRGGVSARRSRSLESGAKKM
jgi:hypothetical protein